MNTPILVQPVVLSGGSGTRLWPLSREKYPKQLLSLGTAGALIIVYRAFWKKYRSSPYAGFAGSYEKWV